MMKVVVVVLVLMVMVMVVVMVVVVAVVKLLVSLVVVVVFNVFIPMRRRISNLQSPQQNSRRMKMRWNHHNAMGSRETTPKHRVLLA